MPKVYEVYDVSHDESGGRGNADIGMPKVYEVYDDAKIGRSGATDGKCSNWDVSSDEVLDARAVEGSIKVASLQFNVPIDHVMTAPIEIGRAEIGIPRATNIEPVKNYVIGASKTSWGKKEGKKQDVKELTKTKRKKKREGKNLRIECLERQKVCLKIGSLTARAKM